MRALVLLTDGFGRCGGIAKFNRDFLAALCSYPAMTRVIALPRLAPEPTGPLPPKLSYVLDGVSGKLSYARTVVQNAWRFRRSRSSSPPRLGREFPEQQFVHCAPGPVRVGRAAVSPPCRASEKRLGMGDGPPRRAADSVALPSGSGKGLDEVFDSQTPNAGPHRDDLIFCAHINLLPLAFLASRMTGARVVLNLHGIDAWSPHRNPLVRMLLPRVHTFIAVSEFTKNRFLAWSGLRERPFFILPNCVDLSAFGAGPKKPELLARYGLANRTVIMTLARLSAAERYKGIDEVLENLPHLAPRVPNLTYMICGDGDDRQRLMSKAAAMGLAVRDCAPSPPRPGRGLGEVLGSSVQSGLLCAPDRKSEIEDRQSPEVIFTGRIPESEKADHFRLADAYVMPGTGEGFGIVYLEALACGIPVVASKHDASAEAVLHGRMGEAVNSQNADELRKGILCALSKPKRIPSELKHFSPEMFDHRQHAILESIMGIACRTDRFPEPLKQGSRQVA